VGIVFTCPPPFIEKVLKEYDEIPLERNGYEEEVPPAVLEKLLKIPYFRKGYEEDGLDKNEFNEHPALKKTARQHVEVTEKMVDFCRRRLEK
jgi:transaldolase